MYLVNIGWSVRLKYKTGKEVAKAFQTIFKDNKPKKLWVDKGKEFYNTTVEDLLKENNIRREIFQTFSQNMLPLLKQIFILRKCQDGTKDTYVERYDLDNFSGMAQLQIDYI